MAFPPNNLYFIQGIHRIGHHQPHGIGSQGFFGPALPRAYAPPAPVFEPMQRPPIVNCPESHAMENRAAMIPSAEILGCNGVPQGNDSCFRTGEEITRMLDQMKNETIKNPNSIKMKQESPSHDFRSNSSEFAVQESPPLTRKSKAVQQISSLSTDSSKPKKRMRRLPSISLSNLIDKNKLSVGDKVFYMRKKDKEVRKEGIVRRKGIECICCGKIYSLSKLEEHADKSSHRASQHIYLESGKSLANCHLEFYQDGYNQMKSGSEAHLQIQQSESVDESCSFTGCPSEETKRNDASSSSNITRGSAVCYICLQNANGLLACRGGCMRWFHTSCNGLEVFRENTWYCLSCAYRL